MMNKTSIDWCDFTWNPVTGCRRGCPYCYARAMARRFTGDIRINLADPQIVTQDGPEGKVYTLAAPFKNGRGKTVLFPAGFEPTFHEYRLADIQKKKKPATIFVCSMADLFSPGIPDEWITRVFEACKAAPWHNYLFLTKYPARYCDLANVGKLPDRRECPGFWYGTTVTKHGDPFFDATWYNTFLSIEPISGSMEADLGSFGSVDWIIAGAETGTREDKVAPERAWIGNIIDVAAITDTPVLLKSSAELRTVWGDDLIQEFPAALRPMSEDNSVPHCRGCLCAEKVRQGKRGWRITCKATGQHIPGRYTRTSPAWCPARKK